MCGVNPNQAGCDCFGSHPLAIARSLGFPTSLALSWGAALLAKRRPTKRRTYGFRSTTIVASLANAVVLLFVTGGIAWESARRFFEPGQVAGKTVIVVALVGVAINAAAAGLFLSGRKGDLNVRTAFVHLASDAGHAATAGRAEATRRLASGGFMKSRRQRQFEVRASRLMRASPGVIFRTYVDYVGWTQWAGFGRVVVERVGFAVDYVAGCIRVLNADGRPGREEILETVSDTRVVYRVIQGLPVSDHRAEVTLSPRKNRLTEVAWTAIHDWPLGGLVALARAHAGVWRTLRRLDLETMRRATRRLT